MTGAFVEEFLGHLNLIHHLSVGEDAKRTQKMIHNIAAIIQYKFVRSCELVPLKEELLQNDILIEIFRGRFGKNLQLIKNIKEEATSIYLPNYTVMAFVENALFHGLVPKEGDWKLTLEIDENEKSVHILIADNGVGFDTEVLKNREGLAGDIGTISYIAAQMRAFYQDSGELHISSSCDKGTRVTIVIPKM